MRVIITTVAAVFTLLVGVSTAAAQTATRENVWSHGTTVTGFAGIATDGSRNGPALGGAIGWEITPRFGLDGEATWAELGDGMSAFGASLKARVRMLGRRPVDPFVHAGVGFYRSSFSATAPRPPAFSEQRTAGGLEPGGTASAYTDPTLVAGGGLNIFVTRHFAIRPAFDATIVFHDRRHYVVSTIAVHAVFHFEDHPVTPSVRTSKAVRRQRP